MGYGGVYASNPWMMRDVGFQFLCLDVVAHGSGRVDEEEGSRESAALMWRGSVGKAECTASLRRRRPLRFKTWRGTIACAQQVVRQGSSTRLNLEDWLKIMKEPDSRL